jgi:betaine-aldehyde dehydrogenase
MTEFGDVPMYIDGKPDAGDSGEWVPSINPANEEVIGRTPAASVSDVGRAVQAAEHAQPAWAEMGGLERARLLRQVAAEVEARADEVLHVEVADTGNTITKMASDVHMAVSAVDFFAGLALELKGETVPSGAGSLNLTVREPFGVVGRIVPFNHPLFFSLGRSVAPLVAGNTVVLKSPDQSPLSGGILGEICSRLLPPGVFNTVTGAGQIAGDALVVHPAVRRIAFTGSDSTGLRIQRRAAESGCVKHLSLELGGKNPMIVFPDNDPDGIAEAAIGGMNFAWQGQSCGSTSRLFLHESLYEEVIESLTERIGAIRVGDPNDPATQMGPINSRAQYEKVCRYVEIGKADGARLATGGVVPSGPEFDRGYWIRPTLFADATMSMRVAREEVFGPILAAFRWSDIDDLVEAANATAYGLTASIWTRDIGAALRTARRVRAGYVWVNGFSTHFSGLPFGGFGNSGTGREESLGELLGYTQEKAINIVLR